MSRFCYFVRLYGVWFALQRVFKALLWKLFRFTWDKAYLMSRRDNNELELPVYDGVAIRQLTMDDLSGDRDWDVYLNGSQKFIADCFDSHYARAYGAFVEGKLAYITWVLYNHIEYNGRHIQADGCAMQWKAYCLSRYRGRGLHSYVKAWAVNEMLRNGVQKCYAMTLSYNRPALKAQKKCGYRIERVFYIIKMGNKTIYKWIN